ncbi:MAG: methyltransferase domain-containing protein [Jiangellaceae bacterium]
MTATFPPDPGKAFAQVDESTVAPILMAYLDRVADMPETTAFRSIAVELMELQPGMRVLDAGSGLGEAARELATLVRPGGEVIAVDLSSQMVAAAAARDGGIGVTYEVADVLDLPFATDSFDRTRCERVLQHLPDPDIAIAELVRVTAPAGAVCLLDPDWRSLAIDVDDPVLVTAVLDTFVARSAQPDIGRTLRRRLVRAGVVDVVVRVQPLTYTSVREAGRVIPILDDGIPPDAGLIPETIRDRWFAALRRSDAEGTFWVAALGYVACGVVPETAA